MFRSCWHYCSRVIYQYNAFNNYCGYVFAFSTSSRSNAFDTTTTRGTGIVLLVRRSVLKFRTFGLIRQAALPRILPAALQGYCLRTILLLRLRHFALAFDTTSDAYDTAPAVCFSSVFQSFVWYYWYEYVYYKHFLPPGYYYYYRFRKYHWYSQRFREYYFCCLQPPW